MYYKIVATMPEERFILPWATFDSSRYFSMCWCPCVPYTDLMNLKNKYTGLLKKLINNCVAN